MDKKQILYSSDEAAKFMTSIEGWVNSGGRFFGEDKHLARYSGCTHILFSNCKSPIPVSGYTIFDKCLSKKNIEKYNSKPRLKWDGEIPLYSDAHDEYFFDEDSLRDYIADHECTIESLRLIICEPNEFREIDSSYFCDELPEDGELPSDLEAAIDELNKVIMTQPPASWSPGKYAADCDL